MKITTVSLKEKNINLNSTSPTKQMRVNMNRVSMMPDSITDNHFQCELKLDMIIEGEEKKVLLSLGISYIVNVLLEKEEVYDKNECSDRIFHVLQAMYISMANNLLCGTQFPPIPLNIKC